MKLEIYPLTPERAADYFAFFDNAAFRDHPEWSWCYCTYYHYDDALEKELNGTGREGLRGYAQKLVREGTLQGYLAYADGAVVGWCNAGDKAGFRRLCQDRKIWTQEENARVKSVVCFIIASEYRRQGVATALLQRVCEDAAAQGYDFVEAYPSHGELDCYLHYHGHEAMYEKCGFVPHRDCGEYGVMRRAL